jgi:toxin ParE1/3/4
MTTVVGLPQFEADLDDIWYYVAARNVAAADALIDRIRLRCEALAEHPELGPQRPDLSPACRQLVVDPYLVLYRISDDAVELVRAIHGRRHLIGAFPED